MAALPPPQLFQSLLSLGSAATPVVDMVDAGVAPLVGFTSTPGHPANVVDVPYRIDGGPIRVLRAVEQLGSGPEQAFAARMPPLATGQRMEYRGDLGRNGRRLGTAPSHGGWHSVIAREPVPGAAPPDVARHGINGRPRFGYGLDFLGAVTVQLRAEVLGHTPQGFRVNFLVEHGEAHGPRLNGRILPHGGDWMCIRGDGVGEVEIRITYQTPDGALLLERSGGVFNIGPEGYAKLVRGVYAGTPPLFLTPTFVTSDPRWTWINSIQCLGFGRVVMKDLRVECDVYAPQLTSGPELD